MLLMGAALGGALVLVALLCANILIRNAGVQAYILREISSSLGYEITAGRINVSLIRGPSLHGMMVGISRPEGDKLTIPDLYLNLDHRKLLRGRFVPTAITLVNPLIEMEWKTIFEREQIPAPYLAPLSFYITSYPASLPELTLENATVFIKDLSLEARNVNGAFYGTKEGSSGIRLSGSLVSGTGRTSFLRIAGNLSRDNSPEGRLYLEATLESTGIPEALLEFAGLKSLKEDQGYFSLSLKTSETGPAFLEGLFGARRLALAFEGGRDKKEIDLPRLEAGFSALLDRESLSISSLRVISDGVRVDGEAFLTFRPQSTPHLRLALSSPMTPVLAAADIVPAFLYPKVVHERIIPLVAGGKVRLERLLLDGPLDSMTQLDLPQNAGAISLKLAWQELEIIGNDLSPAFQSVSGELLLERGDLFISNLSGSSGTSRIEEASMHISSIYGGDVLYSVSGHALCSIKDLAAAARLAWFPSESREAVSWFSPEGGTADLSIAMHIKPGMEKPLLKKVELFLRDCKLMHPKLPFAGEIKSAAALMNQKGKGSFTVSAILGGSDIEAAGSFEDYGQKVQVAAELKIDTAPLLMIISGGRPSPITIHGMVPASLKLTRANSTIACRGTIPLKGISAGLGAFKAYPKGMTDRIDFSFSLEPGKGLLLEKAALTLGKSELQFKSNVSLIDPFQHNFHFKTEKFSLEDLGVSVEGQPVRSAGVLAFEIDLNAAGPSTTFLTPTDALAPSDGNQPIFKLKELMGRMEASGISPDPGILPISIYDGSFRISFSGKELLIDSADLKSGGSRLEFKGNLKLGDGIKGDIALRSSFLRISDFLPSRGIEMSNFKADQLPAMPGNSDVRIALEVTSGVWGDTSFGPLSGDFLLKDEGISIKKIHGSTGYGNVDLHGSINRIKTPMINLAGTLTVKDGSVGELLSPLGLEQGYMEGPLTLEAELSTHGDTSSDLLCHLHGEMGVAVGKGVIRKSHVLLSILRFLSVEKIFFRPPPDLASEGLYFEGIQGLFRFENGIVSTEDLIMQSPVINVAATGSLDLSTRGLKAEIAVQPFGTLDAIASRIPLLGYVLTGKDKTFIVYHFQVEGQIKAPSVNYVPFKNLGSGTVGILHRILLTPGRIIGRISRAAKVIGNERPLSPEEDPERSPPRQLP